VKPATEDPAGSALAACYPALAAMPPPLAQALAALPAASIAQGSVLFDEGAPCRGFPLLLEGTIRVSKTGENGREIVLYRVQPGESCVITSGCLLGDVDYAAHGVAETPLRLVAVPRPLFERLVAEAPAFRQYVFGLFSGRLAELMRRIEEVAFRRLDVRLAETLLQRTDHGRAPLRATHQQLAEELGSVREIVTRLLNQFASEGLVTLGRERIEVRDAAGLAARSV
jgi:CRP/FNR family transcriptional regulator